MQVFFLLFLQLFGKLEIASKKKLFLSAWSTYTTYP